MILQRSRSSAEAALREPLKRSQRGQVCGDGWGVWRRKGGRRGAKGGSPQSSNLIKIFNTSGRPRFDSLKEHRDEKRGQTADCTPWKRGAEEKEERRSKE